MNESLKTTYLIENKFSEYERKNSIEMNQQGSEDKDSLLSNLKKQIDLKVSGASRKLIKKARMTLEKNISKLEENIKQIKIKTEPYKNQVMNYTVVCGRSMSRIFFGIVRFTADNAPRCVAIYGRERWKRARSAWPWPTAWSWPGGSISQTAQGRTRRW